MAVAMHKEQVNSLGGVVLQVVREKTEAISFGLRETDLTDLG